MFSDDGWPQQQRSFLFVSGFMLLPQRLNVCFCTRILDHGLMFGRLFNAVDTLKMADPSCCALRDDVSLCLDVQRSEAEE